MPGSFLDTNVLVYAFTNDPRAVKAQYLLERGCSVSVQVLNEFANVARRKLGMTWDEVRAMLDDVRIVCRDVHPMDVVIHEDGLRIAERYGYSIFDGLVIATALRAGCDVLYSEDMQNGLVVDERLRIVNPF